MHYLFDVGFLSQQLLAVKRILVLSQARNSIFHLDDVERVVSQLGCDLRLKVPNPSR